MSAALTASTEGGASEVSEMANGGGHGRSSDLGLINPDMLEDKEDTAARPPTSAEIDAVIAAAMANAPPAPSSEPSMDAPNRSVTPLMTNLLPAAVGADGRVNLFVGNLPYRVRWQDLKDLFRKAGTVLRADVSLGQDNRSRGYGTVLMGSREDAARAIDRFNGYTWQTRTLEVRPDRLPPEYEPQGHAPLPLHPASRVPMFPFVGTGHFGGPNHQGPGPGWHPPNHHRPPMHFGPHHPMVGTMSHPGMSMSPHPHPMVSGGSAPGLGPGAGHFGRTQSPAPNHFGPDGHPPLLAGQHTGSQGYGTNGASPLAGSLTAGADILPRPASTSSGHLGVSPHSTSLALPREPSPSQTQTHNSDSRPSSSQGHRSVSPGEGSHPNSGLNTMPTVPFPQQGFAHGSQGLTASDQSFGARHNVDHGNPPHLEGLAHRSNLLGPPNTLHDRVVFVSNLPLTMQWQELKDLFRPAGLIIRADVASSPDGRPRGFGTALFGAVQDAARAVNMFNGRELSGRRIRVYLERDSHHHDARRSSHSQTDVSVTGSESGNGQISEPGDLPTPSADLSTPSQLKPSLASRVPWHLNLSTQSTPPRSNANGVDATPHFRSGFPNTRNGESTPHFRNVPHPSHIAMPPWPSLDSPNPLSPLQTRGLPPMTPSMPGFVFNNAYPDTPPIPHHFMGPFSPGLPVTSPTGFAYNPFLNAAPGAPVNRAPTTGGSAQLGTPTTQAFPHNSIRGAGPPGAPVANEDYFPATESLERIAHVTPPSLGPRSISQSVLNARDRLAPTGPDASGADVNSLAASMALHTLTSGQETPPSPTSANRKFKRLNSGADLGVIGEGTNGDSPVLDMGRNGRFSLDDHRPNLDVEAGMERRASFGDSRK